MILRSVDGLVAISGKELALAIPVSGDVRYEVSPGSVGGRLDVLIPEDQDETLGRVILVVGEDELVITSPRTLEVTADGTVSLTLSEYIQLGNALSAIPAKLGEMEWRVAALEAAAGGSPAPLNVTISGEGTGPSGEEG